MSGLISKDWIKSSSRLEPEYIEGVRCFVNFAMEHSPAGLTTCNCPCKKCNLAKRVSFDNLERHLIVNGMKSSYTDWYMHGEKLDKNLAEHSMTQAREEKKKNPLPHTLGRRSYTQIYEILKKENPGSHIKRSDAWKRSVTRKDGQILPSALETYGKVVSAEERRRAIEGSAEYTPQMIDGIENDELVEVFGPEKKKRCRAVSSSSSVKQVKAGQAAKAIAEENGGNQEWRDKIDKIEASIKGIENAVTQIMCSLPQLAAHDNLSARTEFASNSQSCQVSPVNLNTQFDAASERRQKVILHSRERKEVAKGYLATHTICHGRRVMEDERIVWVEEVLDPDSHIYDAPQDGHRLLGDVADGGFLIWLHSRLKYIQ